MLRKITLAAGLFSFMSGFVWAQEPVDLDMVGRITDEGFNRSEVMDTLQYMTDMIGPRLTASPGHVRATEWALGKFSDWGLENAHREAFEFGLGWDYQKALVRMVSPRIVQLQTYPVPWMPDTDGVITAEVIYAPLTSEEDFEKYEGKLEGKIVLVSEISDKSRPTSALYNRYSDEQLVNIVDYLYPARRLGRNVDRFRKYRELRKKRTEFLAGEGVLAIVRASPRDGALIEASGQKVSEGEAPDYAGISLSYEDYARLVRLLDLGETVELEIETEVTFYNDDSRAYNAVAEIPGSDRSAGIVMVGAHFDSWFVGDGAVDNGAGSAVMMEALRILAALDVKPKRTIRIALWGGEEQGLIGSRAYVKEHFGSLTEPEEAAAEEGEEAAEDNSEDEAEKPKLLLGPDYEKLSAYFNFDNGSGKIRGIYAEENYAAVPLFEAWLAPFGELGATRVSLERTGSTDHVAFQMIGLPGFQVIQDPLDYITRLHHTQIDTFNHVSGDDLRQAAVIIASILYHAAMREDRFPRKPVPYAVESPRKKFNWNDIW